MDGILIVIGIVVFCLGAQYLYARWKARRDPVDKNAFNDTNFPQGPSGP